jgi:hypothetical protein
VCSFGQVSKILCTSSVWVAPPPGPSWGPRPCPRPRPPRSHAAITSSIASDGDRFTVLYHHPRILDPREGVHQHQTHFASVSLPCPFRASPCPPLPPPPPPAGQGGQARFEGCQDSASPLRAVSGPGRPPLFTLSSQFLARPLVHRFPPLPTASHQAQWLQWLPLIPCPASTEAPNSSCSQTGGGCLPD